MATTTSQACRSIQVAIVCPFGNVDAQRGLLSAQVIPAVRSYCRGHGIDVEERALPGALIELPTPSRDWAGNTLARQPLLLIPIPARRGVDVPNEHAPHGCVLNDRVLNDRTAHRHLLDAALDDPMMTGRGLLLLIGEEEESAGSPACERIADLTARAERSGFRVRRTDAARFADHAEHDLRELLHRTVLHAGHRTQLESERRAHAAFAASRLEAYVETPEYLAWLTEQLSGGNDRCVVVSGSSGAGKSTLLAAWCDRLRSEGRTVVEHYIGNGSTNRDHVSILERVAAEIDALAGAGSETPDEHHDLAYQLARAAGADLVLALDGLNELETGSADVAWLPRYVPPGVFVVLSSTDGVPLECMRERGVPELAVQPLAPSQRRSMVLAYMRRSGATLSEEHMRHLQGNAAGTGPLALRMCVNELRLAGSEDAAGALIGGLLDAANTATIAGLVIERLEREHGTALVRDALTALWAARAGLSVQELATITATETARVEVLMRSMVQYVIDRDGHLALFHDHLRDTVRRRYLVGHPDAARTARQRIVELMRATAPIARMATEVPWQLQAIGDRTALREAITEMPIVLELMRRGARHELLRYWAAAGEARGMAERCTAWAMRWKPVHPDFAEMDRSAVMEMVGDLLQSAGEYDAAERMLRRAVAVETRRGADNPHRLAVRYRRLAELYYHTQRLQQAAEAARHAVQCAETTHDAETTARCRLALGAIEAARRDGDSATRHFVRAAEISSHAGHALRGLQATALNNLGTLRFERGEVAPAAAYFRQARDINMELLGSMHPEVGFTTANLAFVLQQSGDVDAANALFREALHCAEQALGPHHPQLAAILTNLGSLHRDASNLESAEHFLRRALDILTASLGRTHPQTLAAMHRLAYVLKRCRRFDDSRALYEEAITLHVRTSAEALPTLELCRAGLAELAHAAAEFY